MCGIAGIVSVHPWPDIQSGLQKASDCLIHRGPESESTWKNSQGNVAFAHRRLAIIDRSIEAAQPMSYLSRYTIVFNGEIYNYIELKKELQQIGYSFTTVSDTEVLVASYDCWKENCLPRLEGMFAFAIWDEKEQRLFAARDRFGEKPFFFNYNSQRLIFASEIKAIWSLGVPKEVNKSMLYNFISLGYTTNPGNLQETFYSNIQKLPASYYLTYQPQKNELQICNYWQLYPEVNSSISEKQAIDRFQELFASSVSRRMRSDVPIGTSLSGGLDSSSIVAFCNGTTAGQYTHKCFTASFPDFAKDEWKYAEEVARQFQLQQYKIEIEQQEIVPLMHKVMSHQQEPIGSASILAQFAVFQCARKNGVTVVLDGQGADELLAGYHRYYQYYWSELYRQNKLKKSGELHAAYSTGITERFGLQRKALALFPQLLMGIQEGRKARQAFQNNDLDRNFAFQNKRHLYYTVPLTQDLNGALYHNIFVNGLEELLRYADRSSMAHSVEVRLPYLDHHLVEFLFSLPASLKIQHGWTKWLLRKSVENKLPGNVVWRKDKTGFEPPQKIWMQNADGRNAVLAGKKKLVDAGILDVSSLKKYTPHDAHSADNKEWRYWSASFLY